MAVYKGLFKYYVSCRRGYGKCWQLVTRGENLQINFENGWQKEEGGGGRRGGLKTPNLNKMWTAPNPPSHPAVIASITEMVARMITDYSIHGCTLVRGNHDYWLPTDGEITDSGGGPPPSSQTTPHLSNPVATWWASTTLCPLFRSTTVQCICNCILHIHITYTWN